MSRREASTTITTNYVTGLEQLGISDISRVGGKNASLGEMIRELGCKGIRVPAGFATTASAIIADIENMLVQKS